MQSRRVAGGAMLRLRYAARDLFVSVLRGQIKNAAFKAAPNPPGECLGNAGARRAQPVYLLARAANLTAGLAAAAATSLAFAQQVNITDLQGQVKRAEDSVSVLGPDLMGDRVNLDNGTLEFWQTDTSLPGNNALPVELVRRHTAGRTTWIKREFGNWDLELPRISGNFATERGWVTLSNGTNRCSGYSAPPYVSKTVPGGGGGGGGPLLTSDPSATNGRSSATPSKSQAVAAANTVVEFNDIDYWQGIHIYVNGQTGGEVVLRHTSNTAKPSDGLSYPLVTKSGWQIRCTVSLQNAGGEGFVALAPDGTQYRFDWMVSKNLPPLSKGGAKLPRSEISIYATLVTDRFGNTVKYTFDAANGALLKSIVSSDGRTIALTHDTSNRVKTVNDGTREFVYSYDANSDLNRVTRPDGSYWEFSLRSMVYANPLELGESGNCQIPGAFPENTLSGWIRHPSGALGTFATRYITHGRTNVTQWCLYVGQSAVSAVWPKALTTQGLVTKTLTGPGLGELTWRYSYSGGAGAWAPCTTCSDRKYTIVVDPQGNQTRYTFGIRFQGNEGQLLATDEGWNGSTALRTTTYRYRAPAGMPYPEPIGTSASKTSEYLATKHRPEDRQEIAQQGATFTREVATFDAKARFLDRSLFSSLGYSKTETTSYFDHGAKWIQGQLASRTVGTTVESKFTYDSTTALPLAAYSFGRLLETYQWNADGTLYQRLDSIDRPTTFSSYWRGIARLVKRRDTTQESAEVNNLGKLNSYTNAAGTKTKFGYDLMGRLASVTYPTETTGTYHQRIHKFEAIAAAEFGIPGGHWRETISTGNARTVRYFDAMWRVRLSRTFDTGNESQTSRYTEYRYDHDGRKTFESYPQRSIAAVDSTTPGTTWWFDALDRETAQRKDSELGALDTITEYLPDFQRRVTNPRNFATVTAFQAYDTPSQEHATMIAAPEGVTVSIARDPFGKPSSISRGGAWGSGSLTVTRKYVYDANHRLCKTIEPESGATVQAYDTAGNLAWRASGLSLPNISCDQASVPANRKIEYQYDALDRLTLSTFGDGSPSISRKYTADGLDSQVTSAGFTWTYHYNNRRLLTREDFSPGWSFFHGINAYGHVSSLTYPDGYLATYSPNALGEPTQISGYVDNVTYHPNGRVAGYTLANGILHTVALNTRGLPTTWKDSGVINDLHSYDANGNVLSIRDQLGTDHRSMGYDGLDRLTTANGVWGLGSYAYDPLDNIRSSVVGALSLTHSFNATTNRLSGLSGSQSVAFGYDANGNVSARGSQGFVFDIGNRMRSATGKATYEYDGHGRRSWVVWADNSTELNAYTGVGPVGQLLFSSHSTKGQTRYMYLDGRLVAESNTLRGPSFAHTDLLGSVVARSDPLGKPVGTRTRYEPYGARTSGDLPLSIGFTGHEYDAETSLVYMQQRYYEPVAGRFLSTDPVPTIAARGEFFNRFTYARNNPYGFIDPDGRAPCTGSHLHCEDGQTAPGASVKVYQYASRAVDAGVTGGYGIKFSSAVANGEGFKATMYLAAGVGYGLLNIASFGEGGLTTGLAARAQTLVIGRRSALAEADALKAGEYKIEWESKIPNWKAEWKENSGRLRQAMGQGKPIRDASPGDTGGIFLEAERRLLRDRGWSFNDKTNYWTPPAKPQ